VVTGQHDDEPSWARFPAEPDGDDVLELGTDRPHRDLRPSWWPSRRPPRLSRSAALLAVAALVVGLGVGLGVGYPAGERHHAAAAPSATPSGSSTSAASVAVGGPTVTQTGNLCSAQHGTTLQLGVQVVNDSAAPLTLFQVRTVLPMNGLRVTAVTLGPCGQLPSGSLAENDPQAAGINQYLPAQATGWFTITVKVLVSCPQPLPVQFVVAYAQHGKLNTAPLAGFNDLGDVSYSGCPAS
jgi:hypothetical protein